MTDKPKRGRASKINLLPDKLQSELHRLLRDKSHTQIDVLNAINDLIKNEGLDSSLVLSRSGLNRYATSMEAVGARIREARAVSEQWITQLGTSPEGDVSKILIEMVRTLAFDSVLTMSNEEKPVSPKLLKELAIAVEKLEKAASESQKRELETRKIMATEAGKVVEATAKEFGLSLEFVEKLKDDILGLAG